MSVQEEKAAARLPVRRLLALPLGLMAMTVCLAHSTVASAAEGPRPTHQVGFEAGDIANCLVVALLIAMIVGIVRRIRRANRRSSRDRYPRD